MAYGIGQRLGGLMRRLSVAVVGVLLGVAGCSASGEASSSAPSPPTQSRGDVLHEALQNQGNVDVAAWGGASVKAVDAGARAVCADVQSHNYPTAAVWERVMHRFGVSMSDADYFTRASVKVYCSQYQREVGDL
ncbi:DUF732 domain-containing protein [Streptomyces sp. NPDC047024]|uniref:DUF732 domain-containing protein n=1 Tax=Streptomyces sp. NPDC047024 TaxID=3155476 RepID=UPI00340E1956